MHDEIKELINYRIEQSEKTIEEVDKLIDQQLLVVAINRIYYGIFYVLLALSLKRDLKPQNIFSYKDGLTRSL